MKSISDSLAPLIAIGKKIASKHLIIVILLSLGAVLYAVYTVNQVIDSPDDAAYRAEQQSNSIQTRFDKDTIDKLDRLKARQDQTSPNLPSGRVNPFVE